MSSSNGFRDAEPDSSERAAALGRQVTRGLTWSFAATAALRIGNLTLAIVLARLLAPEDFGVYAIAFSVQTIVLSVADVGMETYLVQAPWNGRRTHTVATLSVVSGSILTAVIYFGADLLAAAFGSPESAPVIELLALSLVTSSIGIVPYSRLLRNFEQKKIFFITASSFLIQASVTLVLVQFGYGPLALGLALLAAQSGGVVLAFLLTFTRPRFGFDRSEVRPALVFGIPAASAAMISLALMNVDNLVIARLLGDAALGYYVIAFSLASWPMSAIGYSIQPVALAAFAKARASPDGEGQAGGNLVLWTTFAWSAAVPTAALMIALSTPLVALLYGQRWLPAAPAVAALGALGAVRVLLDLMDKYLLALGAAKTVLAIHIVWMAALIPAVAFGASRLGIAGAGAASVAIAVAVILPAYLLSVRKAGANSWVILRSTWPPLLAAAPAGIAAHLTAEAIEHPALATISGGIIGIGVYVGLLGRWLLRRWKLRAEGIRNR